MNSTRQIHSGFAGLTRPVMWLIASDIFSQGIRYGLVLYLGFHSLAFLGAFLFGTATGALLAVIIDFGINQHWIRLPASDPALNRSTFTRVLLAKTGLSASGLMLILGIAGAATWNIGSMPAMAGGLLLALVQGLAEACESMCLARHRYRLVSLFRVWLGLSMYGLPLIMGLLFMAGGGDEEFSVLLQIASMTSVAMLCWYAWSAGVSLPSGAAESMAGYQQAWKEARWLGLNQTAIVVDVRAPLVILGLMLGGTAVGLYGLVQRTTAVVELVWASLSKLLLKSYAETASAGETADVRSRMLAASKLTGLIMVGATLSVWAGTLFIERGMDVSEERSVALSLLRWALVAITFSSLKRPLVTGLLALHHERVVSRINVLSAAGSIMLIPLLIFSFGIWGPVIGWTVLEGIACLLLIRHFLSIPFAPRSGVDEPLPQRAGI
ncbi:lipopolysaccharide biosynthesis protein [Nitrospira sp. Nam80]